MGWNQFCKNQNIVPISSIPSLQDSEEVLQAANDSQTECQRQFMKDNPTGQNGID